MITASAIVTGRSHHLQAQNCQDSAVSGQPAPGCAYGFVFDGCGSRFRDGAGSHPSRNETGAHLQANFAAAWLAAHLRPGTALPALAAALDEALVTYLGKVAQQTAGAAPGARRRFIATHLLTTTLGFLVTPAAHAFISAGDGYLVRNGFVSELGWDNHPPYLAYRLLDDGLPAALQLHPLPAGASWLAVASDGWSAAGFSELAAPRPALQLQRRLNQLARAKPFLDDAAVATWHGVPARTGQ